MSTPARIRLDLRLTDASGSDVLELIREKWPTADVTVVTDDEPASEAPLESATRTLREMERTQIEAALESTGGHRAHAAKLLGISERNLYRKIRKYRLGA